MSYFFSHLVEIESVIVELDKMDLSKNEKLHLAQMVDASLHHAILDAIFSQLSEEDKKVFANHLQTGKHDAIWKFLNEKVDHVENKIKQAAEDLKMQLHKDLKEARQRRGSLEATKKLHG